MGSDGVTQRERGMGKMDSRTWLWSAHIQVTPWNFLKDGVLVVSWRQVHGISSSNHWSTRIQMTLWVVCSWWLDGGVSPITL
ncbi:hypothetical protein Sjap_024061 [Stephania japonica]|uniref:Uncharacterized protein n=1 Tax=Stephania japonica TaxID=461633 RepID=A0AAP0HL51_9MAGN